jgi:hypothetical protein
MLCAEWSALNQRLIAQERIVLASAHLSDLFSFTQALRQLLCAGNQFLVFTELFL